MGLKSPTCLSWQPWASASGSRGKKPEPRRGEGMRRWGERDGADMTEREGSMKRKQTEGAPKTQRLSRGRGVCVIVLLSYWDEWDIIRGRRHLSGLWRWCCELRFFGGGLFFFNVLWCEGCGKAGDWPPSRERIDDFNWVIGPWSKWGSNLIKG